MNRRSLAELERWEYFTSILRRVRLLPNIAGDSSEVQWQISDWSGLSNGWDAHRLIGWDIATILVALELGPYLSFLPRLARIPTLAARCGRGAAEGMLHFRDVIRANPVLWLYACLWPPIAIRTLMPNHENSASADVIRRLAIRFRKR